MTRRTILTAVLAVATAAGTAQGQLITSTASLASPTTLGLGGLGVGGVPSAPFGPAAVGPGVTYSYTAGTEGLFYDLCGWGVGTNGEWCQGSLGINQNGVLRFDFTGSAVAGAGLFMNYAPSTDVYLRAYDASNALLAAYTINVDAPILTPGGTNEGAFRGIAFGSPLIAALELEGTGFTSPIAASITFSPVVSAVPEPATLALLGTGLLAVAGVARRRRAR